MDPVVQRRRQRDGECRAGLKAVNRRLDRQLIDVHTIVAEGPGISRFSNVLSHEVAEMPEKPLFSTNGVKDLLATYLNWSSAGERGEDPRGPPGREWRAGWCPAGERHPGARELPH